MLDRRALLMYDLSFLVWPGETYRHPISRGPKHVPQALLHLSAILHCCASKRQNLGPVSLQTYLCYPEICSIRELHDPSYDRLGNNLSAHCYVQLQSHSEFLDWTGKLHCPRSLGKYIPGPNQLDKYVSMSSYTRTRSMLMEW